MPKNNNKIFFVGICAVAAIIIAIIIAIIATRKSGLNDSFFVSDNTKYVVTMEGDEISIDEALARPAKIYIVYYYKDDAITGMKEYYRFNQAADAKAMHDYLKESSDSTNYKAIAVDGNYLVLTANESEYSGKTAEEIQQYIEFLNSSKSTETSDDEENVFNEDGEAIESDDDSE